MYHFFVDEKAVAKDSIEITGRDFNHMAHVLRMKQGERVSVSIIGSDREYVCEIDSFEAERALCRIVGETEGTTELPVDVTLFQGLPKADKMELIIQKAVELGVSRIVPVAMARSVVKLDDKKAASKTARWQGISEAAAKQSKRGIIPEVSEPMSFKEALKLAESFDELWIPYENARGMAYTRELLATLSPGKSIAIFIGPEGGFDPAEIELAQKSGGKVLSLGKRILRTETAGLMILSMIVGAAEE